MKRLALPLLSLACLASTAAAQDASLGALAPARLAGHVSKVPAEESRFLYFQLPVLPLGSPALQVEFQFRVDGQLHLAEQVTVEPGVARWNALALAAPAAAPGAKGEAAAAAASRRLDPDPTSGPALELLSRESGRLEELYRLAGSGHDVEVSVVIDGRAVRELSFAELVAYNRELKASKGFRPLSLGSRIEDPLAAAAAPPPVTTQAFCNTCEASFPGCAVRQCPWWNATMSPVICVPCWQVVQQCFATCTQPPCQPIVTTRTVAQRIGTAYGAPLCRDTFFGQQPTIHITRFAILKETTIQRTQNCDGTVVERVLATRNVTVFDCDQNTFLSCSFSFGFAFPCF
jgi:hypothetical protein